MQRARIHAEGADPARRLEVVTEELAVATEELAAQQQEITALLAREASAHRVLRAVAESVDLPVVTTDADGAVTAANEAASALLGVPLARLPRAPLLTHVAAPHRARARRLLALAREAGGASGELDLVPRHGDPVHAHVALTPAEDGPRAGAWGGGAVSWVLSTPGERPHREPLLRALADLTSLPVADGDRHGALARLTASTTAAVPGAAWTSVTLGSPLAPEEVVADSTGAQAFDGAQWRAGEGPGVVAAEGGAVVGVLDVRADARWPRLTAAVAALPVRSLLAAPLVVDDEVAGVLTVGSEEPGAFAGEDPRARAEVFAGAAAALLVSLRQVGELRSTAEHLQLAMAFRSTIEQAKGLVAAWLGCSIEQAFDVLTQLSQDRNVKVRDVAALLVKDPGDQALLALLRRAAVRVVRRA